MVILNMCIIIDIVVMFPVNLAILPWRITAFMLTTFRGTALICPILRFGYGVEAGRIVLRLQH